MKIATLIVLLLCTLFAKSSDFSVIVHQPFNAGLYDITEDYDRTLSAVGFSHSFSGDANPTQSYSDAFAYLASLSNKYGSQMHFIKVDNRATILRTTQESLSEFNEAVAVLKSPSNGYFVGGHTLDGSLIILKLDANANPIFTKIFGTKNYDRMSNLLLLSDGGVLAIGSSVTSRDRSDALFETGLGNNDIYLTRFSKNGTKLWSKKYGTEHDDEGVDAVEAKDGSIIVVGRTSYDKHRDITIMRINENGNRIWLKQYEGENLRIAKDIIALRDNNFLLSLIEYDSMHKEHIRLIKFDLYKNVLIDKKISTSYPSGLNAVAEFSNGTIMGVGYVKDVTNTDALVMLFNANLELLFQEHYGEENYDLFNAMKILHNSQVAVAGVHTDRESQESNMWIAKLNRDGTMAQISYKSSSFYEKLIGVFAKELEEKKIRIYEDLTIEFIDMRLLFRVGEYRLTQTQKMFLETFSKKLLAFLLDYKESIETLEVSGHTSSEWGSSSFEQNYLNNEQLSLNRAYATLRYIFKIQDRATQVWLSRVFKGSGLSYAKRVKVDEVEDKKHSRRATFKIILK